MQVLVIIVQNGVPHSEFGVATSGATFFRSIGGSFGTAIFGAIFSNVLGGNLASHLHGISLPAGFSAADVTPAALAHLPEVVRTGFIDGYAESIQTVFLIAVPIAFLAFLATWLIPHVELQTWATPAAPATATAPAAAADAASATASAVNGHRAADAAGLSGHRAADAAGLNGHRAADAAGLNGHRAAPGSSDTAASPESLDPQDIDRP